MSVLSFHEAGEAHADVWYEEGGECFTLELDQSWGDRAADHGISLDRSADFEGGLPLFLALRLHQEVRQYDAVSPLAIEGLALELLAASARRAETRKRSALPWLEQAGELLRARFADELSLSAIAHTVGVHPAQARSFRQHHRCSIGDYVRKLRVDFACRQLMTTDRPLAEIAHAAGFADQSHFTKTFRRLMGTTPAKYRSTFGRRSA